MDCKDLVEFIEKHYPGAYKRILENYEKYGNGSNDTYVDDGTTVEVKGDCTKDLFDTSSACVKAKISDVENKAMALYDLFYMSVGTTSALDIMNAFSYIMDCLVRDFSALVIELGDEE